MEHSSYVEVKVSFIHIVVLLVGVIVIGSFLFYLGYQAGKASARNELLGSDIIKTADKSEEIQLVDETGGETVKRQAEKQDQPSISEEIKLHQLPAAEKKNQIKARPLKKQPYWVIQVGAFSDYSNAQKYAARFADMGYPTEINTIVKNNTKLHRVRVGNFSSRKLATDEREKLQKMENKKFTIVKSQ
jgi:cell division protein FtsN